MISSPLKKEQIIMQKYNQEAGAKRIFVDLDDTYSVSLHGEEKEIDIELLFYTCSSNSKGMKIVLFLLIVEPVHMIELLIKNRVPILV